jgi:hypothetical protein
MTGREREGGSDWGRLVEATFRSCTAFVHSPRRSLGKNPDSPGMNESVSYLLLIFFFGWM